MYTCRPTYSHCPILCSLKTFRFWDWVLGPQDHLWLCPCTEDETALTAFTLNDSVTRTFKRITEKMVPWYDWVLYKFLTLQLIYSGVLNVIVQVSLQSRTRRALDRDAFYSRTPATRLRLLRENSRNKRKRQPTGMLVRSSGNHDRLLANASACVSCGFRLRNARNANDCVWMETGLMSLSAL